MKNSLHYYRNWFLAVRPWSFVMTFFCVTTGSMVGSTCQSFSWFLYVLTLLGVVLLHGAANFLNDYYDVASKVDDAGVATARYRPHPLAEGSLSLQAVRRAAVVFILVALVIGLYLTVTRGLTVLVIGLAGLFASVFYTAPPFKYKYSALGEPAVFIVWGPLVVGGASFVQGQSLNSETFLVSIPLGILVALVLLANNIRDRQSDHARGIHTIPVLAGHNAAVGLYLFLIAAAYTAVALMSFFGPLTPWSLIVLLSLPYTVNLAREILQAVPIDADARTAGVVTAFGALLLLSLLVERIL
ncbi:MAG TPA: prenyltransferase [Deltaproteobacteria bacterium]|nr:prenyltransferase [Deltaproteobacteria bacterium]